MRETIITWNYVWLNICNIKHHGLCSVTSTLYFVSCVSVADLLFFSITFSSFQCVSSRTTCRSFLASADFNFSAAYSRREKTQRTSARCAAAVLLHKVFSIPNMLSISQRRPKFIERHDSHDVRALETRYTIGHVSRQITIRYVAICSLRRSTAGVKLR